MNDKTFDRHCLVVDEWFINGFNGTKAYQKYYPKAKDETADSKYRELVGKGRIESYLKSKQETAKSRLRTTHEALLQELENWAYSDITETMMLDPKAVKELPIEVRRLITKFKRTTRSLGENMTEDVVELWFVSKEKAMEMIGKHVGFYEKDNSQKTIPEINIIRD